MSDDKAADIEAITGTRPELMTEDKYNIKDAIERRKLFRIGISVEALFQMIAQKSNLLALYPDAAPRTGAACVNYNTGDQHFELMCYSSKAPVVEDGGVIPLVRNITITEE